MRQLIIRGLAAVGGLALASWLYRLIAPEFVDVAPDRLSPDGHDPAEALSAHLGIPLLRGNSVELLVNGDEIFPAMLSAIEQAEESINLLSYIYWTGAIARKFAGTLAGAARRGVEVRVVLDAIGAAKMDPTLVRQMEEAGCQLAWFNRVRWHSLRRFNHRTHRKVMVVDGRFGFTGGVGIAEEWMGDAEDAAHWRDDHFRFDGPVVRYLQGAFAENWRQATGEVLSGQRMFPDIEPTGDMLMGVVNTAPAAATSEVGLTYWMMARCARERMFLATPYFVPDPDLEIDLGGAAARGVDVRVLIPGDHQDYRLVRHASRTWYGDLLRRGVRIYEYQPTMMHVKAITVDGEWAMVGSANFDSRSFEINFEIAVLIFDRDFTEKLEGSFENDLERAREITLDEVEGWGLAARARNHLARMFREQL